MKKSRLCPETIGYLARLGAATRPASGASAAPPHASGKLLIVSTALSYEVRRTRDHQELAAALRLRHDVFCVEQGVPEREELDGRDHEGIHLVAVERGEVVATCRLVIVGRTGQFSRLAVRREARRRRIATALLEAADAEARAGGARRVVLHAQTYARSLYEQAGYVPRGRAFREAGIEHVAMEKELA